jgi:hypothetical protein
MGRDEQTNKKQNKQTNKNLQVQEQYDLNLSLSSGIGPPAFSPGVGV